MTSHDVAKIYLAHHWWGPWLLALKQLSYILCCFVLWCGASTSPILICTAAMSEPETAALAMKVDNLNTGLFYYLSLHAYDWLTP